MQHKCSCCFVVFLVFLLPDLTQMRLNRLEGAGGGGGEITDVWGKIKVHKQFLWAFLFLVIVTRLASRGDSQTMKAIILTSSASFCYNNKSEKWNGKSILAFVNVRHTPTNSCSCAVPNMQQS